MSKALMNAARSLLGADCLDVAMEKGEVELLVLATRIKDVLAKLKTDPEIEMNQLMDLCAVDYPDAEKRFELVYQLLSLKHNTRLRIVAELDKDENIETVTDVYSSAGWFERETFDMFGIVFDNHPDLRRILTDYDFEGFPLRRDFPLSGHMQVRYNDLEQRVVKEPVQLEEPSRDYDAPKKWQGLTDVQKRGRDEFSHAK